MKNGNFSLALKMGRRTHCALWGCPLLCAGREGWLVRHNFIAMAGKAYESNEADVYCCPSPVMLDCHFTIDNFPNPF